MRLTLILFDQRIKVAQKRFIDSLRVHCKAGAGGNGLAKYGGKGGHGGNIIVQADVDAKTQSLKKLYKSNPLQRFTAGVGGNAVKMAILGSPGKDITIHVPLGVEIWDDEKKEPIGEINGRLDRIVVAYGGDGGNQENQFLGQKGQIRTIRLDLKILADVGLVGFPNAGKSTLLSAISAAKPRIAAFPFTTLMPELGVLQYIDHRQISMADLPGLIEGAHMNVGLGHRFLRHVERTRLLLFVIDITGFQLKPDDPHRTAFQTLVLLNKELELYKESLTDKPAILVVNKMDKEGIQLTYEEFVDQVKNYKDAIDSLEEKMRPTHLVTFDDIIPISGLKGWNIDLVKERIREVIDLHAEKERNEQLKDFRPNITPLPVRTAVV